MSHLKFRSPPAPFSDGTEIREARVWVEPTDALPENLAFETRETFIFVPPPGPKLVTFAFFLGAFFSTSSFLAFFAAAVAFSFPKSKKLPISTFGLSACRASGASGRFMDGAQSAYDCLLSFCLLSLRCIFQTSFWCLFSRRIADAD